MWTVKSLKGYKVAEFDTKDEAVDFMISGLGTPAYNLIWEPQSD